MHPVKVTLNGETHEVRAGATISDLIATLKLADGPIAVERNREVVPKSKFVETPVRDGDRIEVVHFVGGG